MSCCCRRLLARAICLFRALALRDLGLCCRGLVFFSTIFTTRAERRLVHVSAADAHGIFAG